MRALARSIVTVAFAVGLTVTASAPLAYGQGTRIRWDLVRLTSFSPPTIVAGGFDSAQANDNSTITLTGSGTFVAGAAGPSSAAIGGGTWRTYSGGGAPTGSGTYEVTGLLQWTAAPGSLPPAARDQIALAANARSGLAVLRVKYSDGADGVLTVSCHQPVGAPDTIFEGITATKGFVAYWHHVGPVPQVDGNRTIFHVAG